MTTEILPPGRPRPRRFVLDDLVGRPEAILVEDGHIAGLGPEAHATVEAPRIACHGLHAVAGFVDLQVNGVGGSDFTTDPASMWRVGGALARHGVTAFLPTIVSSPAAAVEHALRALGGPPPRGAVGAVPLGLHVEGPFISPRRRGAHEEAHLRPPDPAAIDDWVRAGARIVTVAPELRGGMEAVERIVACGGVAAIGHTDADADTTRRAVDAGARFATHLFNAMPPLHHRAPGAAGALLADERVTLGLIADGVHVDPLVLELVARMAADRIALVSDAVSSHLAGAPLDVAAASARLPDGTLAGGRELLDHGVRTFAAATKSTHAAVRAATALPAAVLGLLDGRGALRHGGRADIVLLDDGLDVMATFVAGEPAHLTDRVRWP